MADNILYCKEISKSFGGVHALDKVNLIVKRGEIHCLAGENGCGKSTIIKAISGFQNQDSGTIEFDGKVYEKLNPSEAIAAGIQVIYQDMSVFPNLSVQENLAINTVVGQKKKIYNRKEQKKIAQEALKTLDLDLPLDVKVEQLPVADKQLIAIARALHADAKLLILDEPTTALTRKEVDRLFAILRDLKNNGITILFVSHKLDEMFEISDSITIMRSGKNVYSSPTSEMTEKTFVHYMTGRDFEETDKGTDQRVKKDAAPILEVNNLCGPGFKDISFKVPPGEILGITGQLGSGRSELCNAIFGILRATSGDIILDGKKITINNVQDAMKNKIALVPEDRLTEGLFLPVSIVDNITVVNYKNISSHGFLSRPHQEEEARKWVDKINVVTSDQRLPAQSLSGGNQQKVVLAKWMSTLPKVLILNGPTVGVDIGAKYDIYDLLKNLAASGIAILVATDDMTEVIKLCDRAFVMKDGVMTDMLQGDQLTNENLTRAAM